MLKKKKIQQSQTTGSLMNPKVLSGVPLGLLAACLVSDSCRLAWTSSTKRSRPSQSINRMDASSAAAAKNAIRQSNTVVMATMKAGAAAHPK